MAGSLPKIRESNAVRNVANPAMILPMNSITTRLPNHVSKFHAENMNAPPSEGDVSPEGILIFILHPMEE